MQVVKNLQASVAAFLGASQKKSLVLIYLFLLYFYLDKKNPST